MKKIIVSLCLLFSIGLAFGQETLTIKGKVSGDTKGHNKVYIYGTGVKTDSAIISNGVFEFKVPYAAGMRPVFYTEYGKKVKGMYRPFPAVIDGPGTLYLNDVDITKDINSGKWSGIKSAEEYQLLDDQLNAMYTEVSKELSVKYPSTANSYKDPAYQKDRDSLIKIKIALVFERFIKSHPDSYASAFALGGMGRSQLAVKDLEKLFAMLSKKRQQSEEGKNVSDYLAGLKNSVIGGVVKDFTLNTPEEKPLSFSSLKGKYVLIDFWASWCGPCKQSFPHMKEVYSKYKSDKFEIYSISIDKDKAAWLKESKVQQLPWLQTLDSKNISQSSFAVTAVPTTYLIDPNGKILMKEVGFDSSGNGALERKLRELFGTK
jgi:thiol-disulfide isomerase/thioredoxin